MVEPTNEGSLWIQDLWDVADKGYLKQKIENEFSPQQLNDLRDMLEKKT